MDEALKKSGEWPNVALVPGTRIHAATGEEVAQPAVQGEWLRTALHDDAARIAELTAERDKWQRVAEGRARRCMKLSEERELYRDNMLFQAGRVADVTAERNELRAECDRLREKMRWTDNMNNKLREELRIEREAVEACEGCDKVDELTAERDKLGISCRKLESELAEKQRVCDIQRESFRKMEADLAGMGHVALALWRRMDALRMAGIAPSKGDLDALAARLAEHGIEAS